MSADRFAEVERLYHEATRRRPEERAAFLDQACGGDDALRHEVESLLSLPTDAGEFLSRTALEEAARAGHRPWEPHSWPTIPGYTVRRVLGEGGMGVVYLAEQETPLRRLVALKLIKPGMDTRQVVARFETERQALALMDHPNIAAVFDAGSTDNGRPYFVMEYVDGVSITEYCDRRRLSTHDRLALFVQVCAAVQHAHQKGVIHRDLKPSNVLVTERDGHALPKVIDFGTAKAVGGAWNATATQGGQGMVLGTLEYMSPEQAALSADIDTATDVYSLGVLLYELLVGRLPFDTDELRAAGYDEIRRVIRESDPPKPSVRVEQRSDTSGAAARARQTDVPGLTRQLRGDLDWIALKALEKDRTRRYATVAAMATDIGRFLDDQPVDARPPSSTYRIRKFTRRHRGAVAAVVSLFVVLVAGLAVSRWQYFRAEDALIESNRQRNEAESERARADAARAAAEAATAEANILRLDAEQQRTKARQDRDLAIAEQGRANTEAARATTQRLITIWQSLARESGRDLASREDDDRAALLARQAFLFHARTPQQPQYIVEDALQKALRLEQWGHPLTGDASESAAYSPDGSHLAVGTRSGVKLWDARKPGTPPLVIGGSRPANAVAFSTDGSHLAAGYRFNGGLELWDARRLDAPPVVLRAAGRGGRPAQEIFSLAFSPDSTRLAAAIRGVDINTNVVTASLQIWDLSNPGVPSSLLTEAPAVEPLSVAFSPDGASLAVRVYDAARREKSLRIWDLKNPANLPRVVYSKPGPRAAPSAGTESMAFSPDGTYLAAGDIEDGAVRIWNVRDPAAAPVLLQGNMFGVSFVTFSPDGTRLASSGQDSQGSGNAEGSVRIFDLRKPSAPPVVLIHKRRVLSVAFSVDGSRLTSAGLEGARTWEVSGPYKPFSPRPGRDVAYSPDGNSLAFSSTDGVRIWNLRNPSSEAVALQGSQGLLEIDRVGNLAFSPNGARLAMGTRDGVRIWDVRNPNAPPAVLKVPETDIWNVGFSPDSTRFAGAGVGFVRLWDMRKLDAPPVLLPVPEMVPASVVLFSPDGGRLAASALGVWLLDVRNLRAPPVRVSTEDIRWTRLALAFSPDGARLAAQGSTLQVFDLRNPKSPPVPLGNRGSFVAFSPDGRRVASHGLGVLLYDLVAPDAPPLVIPAPGPVLSGEFSPDGLHLATGGVSGVQLWPIWTAAADELCTRVWRNLSLDEWRLYVGEDFPYERTCPALPAGAGVRRAPK